MLEAVKMVPVSQTMVTRKEDYVAITVVSYVFRGYIGYRLSNLMGTRSITSPKRGQILEDADKFIKAEISSFISMLIVVVFDSESTPIVHYIAVIVYMCCVTYSRCVFLRA